jgi:hypothetical protein
MTQAEVFNIESLDFEDEKAQRFEGHIISDIIAMSCKACVFYYIRTKRELVAIREQFSSPNYRYTHLSRHRGGNCLHTLEPIPF